MTLEPGLIGYAALASLAFAMRSRSAAPSARGLLTSHAVRAAGWFLLAISAMMAVARLGWGLGMVVWTGQVSATALLLALLLSWRPAIGFALIGPSLAPCLPIYLL